MRADPIHRQTRPRIDASRPAPDVRSPAETDPIGGPICGLLLTVCWAPMGLAIPRLPDLGSADVVDAFWQTNRTLMQAVIVSISIGFLFLLGFLGALTARLRRWDQTAALSYTVFGSAVMFMTLLNVAVGLDAAAGLLLQLPGAESATYLLHTAGFVLAAPAAFAAVGFFAGVAWLIRSTHVFPRWLGWVAVIGVPANIGAVAGSLTLTGAFNSGNGAVAGIAAPLGWFLVWVASTSIWWLRDITRRPNPAGTPSTGRGHEPGRRAWPS